MRILLIEDDADVARLVVQGMAEAGHAVTHADNGETGLGLAVGERFDVMIFDRQLPDEVDGANLLKEVRARGVMTPVLFLSGLGGLQDWIKGLDAGGDDYIVKPFAFQDLLERVEGLQRRAAEAVAGDEGSNA